MAKIDTKSYKEPVETQYLNMFIQDGILQIAIKEIDILNLNFAKACVAQRLTFVAGVTYPTLIDITRVKQSTKEARDYLANEGNALISASAILVSSPMLKMMANFFILVNKPKNPTRMFTEKESAVEWLAQFKQKS